MRLLVILSLAVGAAQGCTLIEGDRILGRDLARADPAYAALRPDLIAGFSPMPGSQRVLDIRHLSFLASTQKVMIPEIQALCFERPTDLLSESMLRPVLEHVLGSQTRLEIVDFSRYPIPKGELVFSLTDLPKPGTGFADPAVTWRGHIKASARSTAVVWAKVRVSRFERWVEAVDAIKTQQTILPGQVAAQSGWRFPLLAEPVRELDVAVGQRASRSISRGQVIVSGMLLPPNDVDRGDAVAVEVTSGAVTLRFTGYAESAGRRNETVLVWVKDMGKRWHARVQEKGRVRIDADQNKPELAVRRRSNARVADAGDGGHETEESGAVGSAIPAGSLSR